MLRVVWLARCAMPDDLAEKAKARRDLRILLICTGVGIVLPVVAFFVFHLRSGA